MPTPAAATDTLNVIVHRPIVTGAGPDYMFWTVAGAAALIVLLLLALNIRRIVRLIRQAKPAKYEFNLGGFKIAGDLEYLSADQAAAWKIYIELVTRVSGNALKSDEGILREALNSLYSAFTALRDTLKNSPAELAREVKGENKYSLTGLTLLVMNAHMRPFLSKWHPLLEEHEKTRAAAASIHAHEKTWARNAEMRKELAELQHGLAEYVAALKAIAEGKKA
jgi:hypothetical protein